MGHVKDLKKFFGITEKSKEVKSVRVHCCSLLSIFIEMHIFFLHRLHPRD